MRILIIPNTHWFSLNLVRNFQRQQVHCRIQCNPPSSPSAVQTNRKQLSAQLTELPRKLTSRRTWWDPKIQCTHSDHLAHFAWHRAPCLCGGGEATRPSKKEGGRCLHKHSSIYLPGRVQQNELRTESPKKSWLACSPLLCGAYLSMPCRRKTI